MPAGIEVWDGNGALLMDGAGRYGRVVDIFQPSLATGSKTYDDVAPESLDFVYLQGDYKVLTVWKDGQTIHWKLDDNYYAGGFRGGRQLIVVSF